MSVKGIRFNQMETAEEPEVDYELLDTNGFFSSHANAIPIPSAVQGPRIFYGSRFFEQALPLVANEAPLVKNLENSSGRSFDYVLGEAMGARRTKAGGTVKSVGPESIVIKGDDGQHETVELYNLFPGNRKTLLDNTPLVQPGQRVAAGGLLAKSNFTDGEGRMALGRNARIGLVPYKGYSMDDALVISQSFANKLTSDHAEAIEQEADETLTAGLDHYVSLFPKKFKTEQLANIDDQGVVKVGTILQPGDPLLLQTKPRSFSSANEGVSRLSRSQRFVRRDAAKVWDGLDPAEVLDVARTRDGGTKVLVRYQSPARPGDKVVARQGAKCYHPDTEVFTERGWVPIAQVTMEDKVASLYDDGYQTWRQGNGRRKRDPQELVARFEKPLAVVSYAFDGELFGLNAAFASYLVTGNHRVWRKGHTKDCSRWYCQDASEVHGGCHSFMLRAPFDLSSRTDPEYFEVPEEMNGITGKSMGHPTRFPFAAWVQFMAFYLAEGNVRHACQKDHSIIITQKQRPYCRVMEQCFDAMGLPWKYFDNPGQYNIGPNKSLRRYLDQFGKASHKHVPDEIKNASSESIELFLKAYWQGDGNKDKESEFYTTSDQMADDLQQLLVMSGRASTRNTRAGRPRPADPEKEPGAYLPLHTINVLEFETVGTRKNYLSAYFKEAYKGNVHCLQVPGLGVLYTRFRGRALWNGNSTISLILPDDHMPRTSDGQPLEILLNQLSLPSRVNSSTFYELLLGKIASKTGRPYTLPAFLPKGQTWWKFVEDELAANGVDKTERVYDPKDDRWLENPITVGNAHVLKLHHMAAKKMTSRGQASYSLDRQPARGGHDGGGAQRLSGLEMNVLQSSGARGIQREAILLRGEKRDDYWRQIRANRTPPKLDKPFVWNKFMALLAGTGVNVRDMGGGRLRLAPMTDRSLAEHQPMQIKNDGIVDLQTMTARPGGLFDPQLVREQRWGHIQLPFPVVNPSYEETIRQLLGLTDKDYQALLEAPDEKPEVS